MVLKRERAAQMSVYVVRAFAQMRNILRQRDTLSKRMNKLEKIVSQHHREIEGLVVTFDELSEELKGSTRKKIAGFGRKLKKSNGIERWFLPIDLQQTVQEAISVAS